MLKVEASATAGGKQVAGTLVPMSEVVAAGLLFAQSVGAVRDHDGADAGHGRRVPESASDNEGGLLLDAERGRGNVLGWHQTSLLHRSWGVP